MKILVINAGSSSLKYQLINMEDESVVLKGVCERITATGGILTQKTFDDRKEKAIEIIRDSGVQYEKVGVFGSYARGEFKTSSDIDFCIINDGYYFEYGFGNFVDIN